MEEISFKDRVRSTAISEAKAYKNKYVNYEYLVCSEAFVLKDYYIINCKEENYQHLIGVNSELQAQVFFEKCYNGTLKNEDFDFIKRGQSEKSVKGSVRRKIAVLSSMMNLFYNHNLKVEESFVKNQISCSFATTDNICTLGFINTSKSYPKTLIKGNELNSTKTQDVSLVLRKKIENEKFDEIIIGDLENLKNHSSKIENLIDLTLINHNSNNVIKENQDIINEVAATEFYEENNSDK
ncbi:hypothetical protein JHL18_01585 [Clostridium sp. YIM B02505]|uniref:Phage-Barnase-EndoU-ColicinE5/D-RelE like nuclease 4 domain-containing protein n=1 Tax=Clostridium yunnanense TaxID=2800325 RepID=A0ABS1EIZ5_9CLOT|nr:PBECR4 domain-containing protein [Clostridium yunnanense]MBK1809337.1 hypothetical protein [Clostridium yunnanense]